MSGNDPGVEFAARIAAQLRAAGLDTDTAAQLAAEFDAALSASTLAERRRLAERWRARLAQMLGASSLRSH